MQSNMCTELFFKDKTMTCFLPCEAQTRTANISGASPADRQAAGFYRPGKTLPDNSTSKTRSLASPSNPLPAGAAHPGYLRSDGATGIYDVGAGPMALDIEAAYFTPPRPGEQVDLEHPAVVDAHGKQSARLVPALPSACLMR